MNRLKSLLWVALALAMVVSLRHTAAACKFYDSDGNVTGWDDDPNPDDCPPPPTVVINNQYTPGSDGYKTVVQQPVAQYAGNSEPQQCEYDEFGNCIFRTTVTAPATGGGPSGSGGAPDPVAPTAGPTHDSSGSSSGNGMGISIAGGAPPVVLTPGPGGTSIIENVIAAARTGNGNVTTTVQQVMNDPAAGFKTGGLDDQTHIVQDAVRWLFTAMGMGGSRLVSLFMNTLDPCVAMRQAYGANVPAMCQSTVGMN